MRVDQVIRDPRRTLQEVLRAFDHNLTARDNFAPEGTLHQVLMSNGPNQVPSYQTLTPDIMDVYTKEQVDDLIGSHKHAGEDIVSGQVGPQFLGTGTRDGTNFLRDDGAYSKVPWTSLTGVPTDFKGYGLDDDVLRALAPYSRIGHRHVYQELLGLPDFTVLLAPYSRIGHVHDYNSLMNLPAPVTGVTLDVLRQELIGYQRRGQFIDYNQLQNLPSVTGVTTVDLRNALAPYSRIGHVHDYNSLMNLPVGGGGLTLQDVRNELIGYQRRGRTLNYDELQNQPNFLAEGRGYSRIGHNQYFEMEAVAQEYILVNQIFGG